MLLKLLCDENIGKAVVVSLQEMDFNVACAKPGSSDSEIALQAKKEKRIIITFDSDFSNILAYPPKEYFGIVRLKIYPPFNNIVINALKNLFSRFKNQKDFYGKLFIVEATALRIYE